MASVTKQKGDVGVVSVMADLTKKGVLVCLPFGDNAPFDLVAYRNNKFERIQCKYTKSDGILVKVKCRSTNGRINHNYTPDEVDWIATYDLTTNCCYYIHSSVFAGMSGIHLRLKSPKLKNKNIRNAEDFLNF